GRAEHRGGRPVRLAGRTAGAGGDPPAARPARGWRDRRVLPLGLALGRRRDGAPCGRLPGPELPRLVARVVAPRRASARALVLEGRDPRGPSLKAQTADAWL